MPICDACGTEADAEHIRLRIERLELTTRFRPVHIQVLLIDGSAPARMEDCFYRAAPDAATRSLPAVEYHDALFRCAGLEPGSGQHDETLLADFQRRGFFLAHAVECPVKDDLIEDAVRASSGTLLKRVQYSYRPKHIALFAPGTISLISPLRECGWGDHLILDEGRPFAGPNFSERFRESLSITQ